MDRAKLTDDLVTQLDRASAADLLEIVLELRAPDEPEPVVQGRSRAEQIGLKKGAFGRGVAPVEAAIQSVGGEVTGTAWINHTLRARVPAEGVGQLSDLDAVAALDTPHLLTCAANDLFVHGQLLLPR
jgi:hypothetical protein